MEESKVEGFFHEEKMQYLHVLFSKPIGERYILALKSGYDAPWHQFKIYFD
jgi:hypothetical protein